MPTASERAASEAEGWDRLTRWGALKVPDLYADRPACEREVVIFFDPSQDLARRAETVGAQLSGDLDGLARLGSLLAVSEAEAWQGDVPDAAMRAFHDRRNLVGDRILHWAVPWLDAVGRCYPIYRVDAHADRDWLLELAEEMRILPDFAHGEGLTLPGEDSYGPAEVEVPWTKWIRSIWSGRLVLDATLRSMGCDPDRIDPGVANDLAILFEVSSARWAALAASYAGSAGLWSDLAARAERTAKMLGAVH